ncbi:MAG: pyridoxine 5'-phosphate synthase [Cryomorphaceae bacterium]
MTMHPARLSVNINKIATLRNARGGALPNVLHAAERIQAYGAQGITVHPRPDERHIRYADARALREVVHTEYNIEGYPDRRFIDVVLECQPDQVTLVPDGPDVLTSNAGWDALKFGSLLQPILAEFKAAGIRTSLFMECHTDQIQAAAQLGTDRIELYTESYAVGYAKDPAAALAPYILAARVAKEAGLGVNAGHDLSSENLAYFAQHMPDLDEVSIGHALISEALYLGLENTVQRYRQLLSR